MLLFSMMMITSFKFSLVTKKTFAAVALNGAFLAKLAVVTFLWRLGTLYLEYMFGVVRCRGNTDGLTLMMLQYYFQKISLLWQICNTQGFLMVGKETRGYRATAAKAMRCKVPLPADGVSDV